MNQLLVDTVIPLVPDKYVEIVNSILKSVKHASLSSFEGEVESHIIVLGELKDKDMDVSMVDKDIILSTISYNGNKYILLHVVGRVDNGAVLDSIREEP